MSIQFSIPLAFALLALFIADEKGDLIRYIYTYGLRAGRSSSAKERLAHIGKSEESDFENFRISQMALMATILISTTAGLFLDFINFGGFLLLSLVGSLLVIAFTERNLNTRVATRKRDIEGEFPVIVEMLTLAVGAGESPASAIKRITQRADGYISSEFSRVIREAESGVSFSAALDAMGRRISSVSLRRFIDSLIISIARGTPLVETLTHGVNESRNQERVRLLTAAGKSEISMMIPVVFLILPISILFALYPSLTNLNLFSS
jgi:tight adherence protein C